MLEPWTMVTCGIPACGQPRLVREGGAAGDEQLGLIHQVGAAGFDHRHHRQLLIERDLLQAQGLLHAEWRHRAALDRRVRGDDHAAHAGHVADASDHVAAGQRAVLVVMHLVAAQGRQFEPRRAAIEHQVHPLARQQLLALVIAGALCFFFGAALVLDRAELGNLRQQVLAVLLELRTVGIDLRFDDRHERFPMGRAESSTRNEVIFIS